MATSSDDNVILLWKRSLKSFGNFEAQAAATSAANKTGQPCGGGGLVAQERPNDLMIPTESYTSFQRMTSQHSLDVNGIAWSPKRNLLATSSLDGTVCIWGNIDAENESTPPALLKRLTSNPPKPLKGISWDPLDQLLVVQRSDSSTLIWRIDLPDYPLLHCLPSDVQSITVYLGISDRAGFDGGFDGVDSVDGFDGVGSGVNDAKSNNNSSNNNNNNNIINTTANEQESYTYFSRMSFSPDGSMLVIPDLRNGTECVAYIIDRKSIMAGSRLESQTSKMTATAGFSLVGHPSSVTVARFSGNIFLANDSAAEEAAFLVGLGSQDGLISLWMTGCSRPLAVVDSLFSHAIMDICFDAYLMYVCSYDGTVAMFDLSSLQHVKLGAGTLLEDRKAEQLLLSSSSFKTSSSSSSNQALKGFGETIEQIKKTSQLESIILGLGGGGGINGNGDVSGGINGSGGGGSDTSINTINTLTKTTSKTTSETTSKTSLKPGEKRRITPESLMPSTATATATNHTKKRAPITTISTTFSTKTAKETAGGTLSQQHQHQQQQSLTINLSKSGRRHWLKGPSIKATATLRTDGAGGVGGAKETMLYELQNSSKGRSTITAHLSCDTNTKQNRKVQVWKVCLDAMVNHVFIEPKSSGIIISTLSTPTSPARLLHHRSSGPLAFPPLILNSNVAHLSLQQGMLTVLLENGSFSSYSIPSFDLLFDGELGHGAMQYIVPAGSESVMTLDSLKMYKTSLNDLIVEFEFGNGKSLLYSSSRKILMESLNNTLYPSLLFDGGDGGGSLDAIAQYRNLLVSMEDNRLLSLERMENELVMAKLVGVGERIRKWSLCIALRLSMMDPSRGVEGRIGDFLDGIGGDCVHGLKEEVKLILLKSESPIIRDIAASLCDDNDADADVEGNNNNVRDDFNNDNDEFNNKSY